ncbi:RNA polymerase III RPC4-domain-containing protein [Zopfochytrium polystomum]|nr:RNA polymerase III RPC4-domain-containing protein [Zopfochytrium polystomum]
MDDRQDGGRNETGTDPDQGAAVDGTSTGAPAKRSGPPKFKPNIQAATMAPSIPEPANDIEPPFGQRPIRKEFRQFDRERPRRERPRIEDTMMPAGLFALGPAQQKCAVSSGGSSRSTASAGGAGIGGSSTSAAEGTAESSKRAKAPKTGLKTEVTYFDSIAVMSDEEEEEFDRRDQWNPLNVTKAVKKLDGDGQHTDVTFAGTTKDRPENADYFADFLDAHVRQLLYFQLPSDLPEFEVVPTEDIGIPVKEDPDAPSSRPSLVNKGPEGLVGKLQLFRSGRMKIVFGSIALDVTPAPTTTCIQEVVSVDKARQRACVLGPVSKRYLCTPNIDDLLTAST